MVWLIRLMRDNHIRVPHFGQGGRGIRDCDEGMNWDLCMALLLAVTGGSAIGLSATGACGQSLGR